MEYTIGEKNTVEVLVDKEVFKLWGWQESKLLIFTNDEKIKTLKTGLLELGFKGEHQLSQQVVSRAKSYLENKGYRNSK